MVYITMYRICGCETDFASLDDAINFDMKHNPELHSTKEQSQYRIEQAIYEVTL